MYRPGFPPPYGAFGAPPQSYMPPGAPPPYGYGGPTGFPGAAPQPARRPGLPPPKSTTLWVGKIPASLNIAVMRPLLEACGPVREWKPVLDADSGKHKGFGFCTYEEADGVLLALRLLHNLAINGQELQLKCNTATEEFVQFYKAEKQQRAVVGAGVQAPGQLEAEAQQQAEAENAAYAKVMALVNEHGERVPPADAAAAATEFLTSLGGAAASEGAELKADKSVDRKRERELEKELERERQRQRREEQRKQEQEERAYREAQQKWEMHERERGRQAEKEADKERDLQKERQRQVHADNEVPDSDEDEEPCRRRPYRSSRRAVDRRRRRLDEEKEDAADRAKEQEERAAAASGVAPAKPQPAAAEQPGTSWPAAAGGRSFDADDAIYQAMMAAAKSTAVAAAALTADVAREPSAAARRKVMSAPFGEEEEEAAPQRKLIPIRYSEEEVRALEHPPADVSLLANVAVPPAAAAAAAAAPEPSESAPAMAVADPAVVKRQLMASIPKDREGVFSFPIKWEVLDRAGLEVKGRIAGWVSKKIKDLMGMEESSFCDFIMEQITGHAGAKQVLEAVREILDVDADSFVLKLYQVLIYESEKVTRLGS